MIGLSSHTAAQVVKARADFVEMARIWRGVAAASACGARTEAEVQVFNQLVVALEGWSATPPGLADRKSNAVVQEVRLLAQGVRNGGRFPEVRGTVWRPDASVTGYRAGDRIRLSEEVFTRLAEVFMDGIAKQDI